MKIDLIISTESLGENTTDDNERYAAAVEEAISQEYPEATVSVEISDSATSNCNVWSDDIDVNEDEVAEKVGIIQNEIWEVANY